MWFLIKTSMVFTMGLVVLSYFSSTPEAPVESEAGQLQISDAISAATQAYGYVSALCLEKPDVCEKGSETFTAIAIRAKEGARVAYEFLDSQLASEGDMKPAAGPTSNLVPKITVSSASSPAAMQPMPPALAQDAPHSGADAVVTGTVPLPQKRPDR
jgi:Family of unknown function (DUF5330)